MKCIDTLLKSYENKRIGNHRIEITAKEEKYYYHNTCICNIDHSVYTITFDNGGFLTSSTTRAINCYKRSGYVEQLVARGYEIIEK